MNDKYDIREAALDSLILQYEQELKGFIVMDDYDGGQAELLRVVIKDLKSLGGRREPENRIGQVWVEGEWKKG